LRNYGEGGGKGGRRDKVFNRGSHLLLLLQLLVAVLVRLEVEVVLPPLLPLLCLGLPSPLLLCINVPNNRVQCTSIPPHFDPPSLPSSLLPYLPSPQSLEARQAALADINVLM